MLVRVPLPLVFSSRACRKRFSASWSRPWSITARASLWRRFPPWSNLLTSSSISGSVSRISISASAPWPPANSSPIACARKAHASTEEIERAMGRVRRRRAASEARSRSRASRAIPRRIRSSCTPPSALRTTCSTSRPRCLSDMCFTKSARPASSAAATRGRRLSRASMCRCPRRSWFSVRLTRAPTSDQSGLGIRAPTAAHHNAASASNRSMPRLRARSSALRARGQARVGALAFSLQASKASAASVCAAGSLRIRRSASAATRSGSGNLASSSRTLETTSACLRWGAWSRIAPRSAASAAASSSRSSAHRAWARADWRC